MRLSPLFNRAVAVLSIALFTWSYFNTTTSPLTQRSSPATVSVIVQDHLKKNGGKLQAFSSAKPIIEKDGSLNVPSEEELQHFPGATVVEADEVEGPEANQYTRVKILQTDFKSPMVRSEEVIDKKTGKTLAHEEMAANHLLVSLPPGEDPEIFLRQLGPHATAIQPVTPDGPYIVYLDSYSIASLSETLTVVKAGEPDFIHHPIDYAGNPNSNWHWGLDKVLGGFSPFTFQRKLTASSPLIAAVIDTGIRYTHQELNIWNNPSPQNGDLYGTNTYSHNSDPMDDNGHGTFCAGIIGAAGNNSMGFIGVTPGVQLMACKAFDKDGSAQISDEIAAIDYACKGGAFILNCSWGGSGYSQALYDALDRARQAGVICVAAAGNDGLINMPFYPASYGSDNNDLQYYQQKKLDNVLAVAASTETDELASFSNYGSSFVSIAAPGVDIHSAFNASDDSYASGSGTSFAAPYVTGALLLLKSQFPNDSYDRLINRLFNAADKPGGLTGKVTFGRLNIARALKQQ